MSSLTGPRGIVTVGLDDLMTGGREWIRTVESEDPIVAFQRRESGTPPTVSVRYDLDYRNRKTENSFEHARR